MTNEERWVVVYRRPNRQESKVFGPDSEEECEKWKRQRDRDSDSLTMPGTSFSSDYFVRRYNPVIHGPVPNEA